MGGKNLYKIKKKGMWTEEKKKIKYRNTNEKKKNIWQFPCT